jgi:hypothetical protein
MGKPEAVCEGCGEPAAYKALLICQVCKDSMVVLLCRAHLFDPGPLLQVHCTHEKLRVNGE